MADRIVNAGLARRQTTGLALQIGAAVAAMAAAQVWIGWPAALVWFLVFVGHFGFVAPALERIKAEKIPSFLRPYLADAKILLLSLLFSSVWIMAWLRGGAEASFFAAICFSGALLSGIMYFSAAPRLLLVYIAPGLTAVLVAPFLTGSSLAVSFALVVTTVMVLLIAYSAWLDRVDLFESIAKTEGDRIAAVRSAQDRERFLVTMSHELRTPLNGVIGYAEILQENLDARGEHEDSRDAQRIQHAAKRSLEMISQILEYTELEYGRRPVIVKKFNLCESVSRAIEASKQLAQQNRVEVAMNIDAACAIIHSDAAAVERCLAILVSNACKFTQNGRVLVKAERSDAEEGAHQLAISVVDTGRGIESDSIARIFDPFEQAESGVTRRFDGAGLGLAIVRSLAKLLDGSVTVRSEIGQGSTFVLCIPLDRSLANAEPFSKELSAAA